MRPAVGRLRERRDFLRVAAGGKRGVTPGLILQARPRPAAVPSTGRLPRVGLTASRKVGGAVERNRARRRLRGLVQEIMPSHAAPENDYVLVARRATVTRPYAALRGDLQAALRRCGAWRPRESEEL